MGLEPHTIDPKRFDLEDIFMGFISEQPKVKKNP
jgi:hypothetical protein